MIFKIVHIVKMEILKQRVRSLNRQYNTFSPHNPNGQKAREYMVSRTIMSMPEKPEVKNFMLDYFAEHFK